MNRMPLRILALSAVVAAAIGCGGGDSGAGAPAAPSSTTASTVSYSPKTVLAGLPVSLSTDTKPYERMKLQASRFGSRPDPFRLTAEEAAYDEQQNVERILGAQGGFTTQYQPPEEETKEVPVDEPQPYRRLAGIIVGDSVLAIIDMGDGSAHTIIRPGEKIPNSVWTVVSIDQDKAVLHRDGTVGPHTISVRLESPPAGFQSSFGGPPPTGTGGPPGSQRPGMGRSGGPGRSGGGGGSGAG